MHTITTIHEPYDKPLPYTFTSLTKTKFYVPIPSCVLEHILTTTNLTNREKLYYILANSLAIINKNQGGGRSCALPSEDWAERLNCSRSLIFTMQSSLVKKAYFIIEKDHNELGLNKRNVITPTLPSVVFNYLNEKYQDKIGEHLPYKYTSECKLAYLDRTKLFIKINYNILKLIISDAVLNTKQKVMWLRFYIIGYKNFMSQRRLFPGSCVGSSYYDFSFISSYREIADIFSSNRKDISKSIRVLEKLGLIKTQNIYIRKQGSNNKNITNIIACDHNTINNYDDLAERQDKSLWKITVSLPHEYILELDKVKDRTNLNKTIDSGNIITSPDNSSKTYFVLDGIRFNLSNTQKETLKVITHSNEQEQVINLKLDMLDQNSLLLKTKVVGAEGEGITATCPDSDNIKKSLNNKDNFLNKKDAEEKNTSSKFDPDVAKSGLLLNKYLKEKIKDIKSNLCSSTKVIFNDFLKELFVLNNRDCESFTQKEEHRNNSKKIWEKKEFNIHSELVREKLRLLPKEKADKARKFAYFLVTKKLVSGYASSLTKNELAKELIVHAATWKPTKLGDISKEKEIDTALSVAWKAIVNGKWESPIELSRAKILEYEYKDHREKYKRSGIISQELKILEIDTEKLLGRRCNLEEEIKQVIRNDDGNKYYNNHNNQNLKETRNSLLKKSNDLEIGNRIKDIMKREEIKDIIGEQDQKNRSISSRGFIELSQSSYNNNYDLNGENIKEECFSDKGDTISCFNSKEEGYGENKLKGFSRLDATIASIFDKLSCN